MALHYPSDIDRDLHVRVLESKAPDKTAGRAGYQSYLQMDADSTYSSSLFEGAEAFFEGCSLLCASRGAIRGVEIQHYLQHIHQ